MKKVRHDFTTKARDRAKQAIEAGRKEEALKAIDEICEEARPIHDLYGDMSAVFLDFIKEKLGEEAIEEAWRYLGERLWRPVLEAFRGQSSEALAATYAMFLRSHGYDFTCEEDDEKFNFLFHFCPSGGRMLQEGKAETSNRHPLNLGVTKKPYSWGFNQKGVLYYCAHTQLWFDTMPREWGMHVFSSQYGEYNDKGQVVGRPCSVAIYKRARNAAAS